MTFNTDTGAGKKQKPKRRDKWQQETEFVADAGF